MPPARPSSARVRLDAPFVDKTNALLPSPVKAGVLVPAKTVPATSSDGNADEVKPVVVADKKRSTKLTITIKPTPLAFYKKVVKDENLHHHYFWDPKGDFVFTTDRKVFFCVQSSLFMGYSMPLTKRALACAGESVAMFKKTSTFDWECFLGLFTSNAQAVREPTMREAIAVLRLSFRYNMPTLRMWAEARLRAYFFYTPDEVRKHSDTRAPRAIEGYEELFVLAEKQELDPYIFVLACYAALINVEWDDDDGDDFYDSYPRPYAHIMIAKQRLQERYSLLLNDLIEVPDTILHASSTPLSCKAALMEWFPVECPEDVVGTLEYMFSDHAREDCDCCDSCRSVVEQLVQEARDQVWHHLPRYFAVWVPTDGSWVPSNLHSHVYEDAFRV